MSEPQVQRASGVPPWIVRWLVNVALYMVTTLTGALIVLVFYDFRNNWDLDFLLYAWTLATLSLAPGGLAYFTLLELIPTRWSRRVRRALAVFLPPLMFLGAVVYEGRGPPGFYPWGYALLAAFGFLVRLRQPIGGAQAPRSVEGDR